MEKFCVCNSELKNDGPFAKANGKKQEVADYCLTTDCVNCKYREDHHKVTLHDGLKNDVI